MQTLRCPSCKFEENEILDQYKHLMNEDIEYLGEMQIFRCKNCELGFAHPFPSIENLNMYYKNIYRKHNSPHFVKDPGEAQPRPFQKSQYSYISQFIDFESIKKVADYGSGYGLLLREIRNNHPTLELFALDPDVNSLSYLKSYKINIMNLMGDQKHQGIDEKYDLIISSHSLEHMTDPNMFFECLKKSLSDKGKVFLEVPNCPFTENGYKKRPYDSPHMLFLTEKSLIHFSRRWNLKIEHITTSYLKFNTHLINMRETYKRFNTQRNNTHGSPMSDIQGSIRSILKPLIPLSFRKAIRYAIYPNGLEQSHFEYGRNRCNIRCIISQES